MQFLLPLKHYYYYYHHYYCKRKPSECKLKSKEQEIIFILYVGANSSQEDVLRGPRCLFH